MNWEKFIEHISQRTFESNENNLAFFNKKFRKGDFLVNSVGGGCINQCFKLEFKDYNKTFFIKINSIDLVKMFEAEYFGLEEIIKSNSIKVPNPICFGKFMDDSLSGVNSFSYLILDYLELISNSTNSQKLLGTQLAKMHRYLASDNKFGWNRNNTIGSTIQINKKSENWQDFFLNNRLIFQCQLAKKKGLNLVNFDKLIKSIGSFFIDYKPSSSLVHGDLWGGNVSGEFIDGKELPVIYDPAVYYGDREVDIAFTEVFGGFSDVFYDAYNDEWKLDKGYKIRKELYNLYHILNHFNLFGGQYGMQANGMVNSLVAKI